MWAPKWEQHERIHIRREFECARCKMSFASQDSLRKHQRRMHGSIKATCACGTVRRQQALLCAPWLTCAAGGARDGYARAHEELSRARPSPQVLLGCFFGGGRGHGRARQLQSRCAPVYRPGVLYTAIATIAVRSAPRQAHIGIDVPTPIVHTSSTANSAQKSKKVPPRFELGVPVSKTGVLTTTPRDRSLGRGLNPRRQD